MSGNEYLIRFRKKGKPTGTRKFTYIGNSTYEDILRNCVLNRITTSVYGTHMDFMMLGNCLQYTKKRSNSKFCFYEVEVRKLRDFAQIACIYEIEIECLFDTGEIDINEEIYDNDVIPKEVYTPSKKDTKPTKWLMKERPAIRRFLYLLHQKKQLTELRKYMSKATFYRNLKYCEEKGYIKNGKLVRKVVVPVN